MKTIQMTIQQLEAILESAKKTKTLCRGYSDTIEINLIQPTLGTYGGDFFDAHLLPSDIGSESILIY